MEEEGQLGKDALWHEPVEDDGDFHSTGSDRERRSQTFWTQRERKKSYNRRDESRDLQLVREDASQRRAALERLIEHHIGLAVQPAEDYARPEFGLEVDDLVSFGMEYLAQAVSRFDPRRDTRFSTFARSFVARRVRWAALAYQSGLIPLPTARRSEARELQRARATMCQISGCEPSETELAEKLGWTIEKVRDTEAAMHSVVSYDALKIEKPIDELFELTGGEHHSGVMERKEEVAELLGCLEERERRVLLLHYAPLGGTPLTLAQIGLIYAVSKEQVRRIEEKALKKIRATYLLEKLRSKASSSGPGLQSLSLQNDTMEDSHHK